MVFSSLSCLFVKEIQIKVPACFYETLINREFPSSYPSSESLIRLSDSHLCLQKFFRTPPLILKIIQWRSELFKSVMLFFSVGNSTMNAQRYWQRRTEPPRYWQLHADASDYTAFFLSLAIRILIANS
jgi:hypothetical protein